jgi:hypothetical protein
MIWAAIVVVGSAALVAGLLALRARRRRDLGSVSRDWVVEHRIDS